MMCTYSSLHCGFLLLMKLIKNVLQGLSVQMSFDISPVKICKAVRTWQMRFVLS